MRLGFLLTTITYILLVCSCLHSNNSSAPDIKIISPNSVHSISTPDTVQIRALITDDQNIDIVSLRLVDENKIPAHNAQTYSPPGIVFNLDKTYYIDDPYLPSGKYYVRIKASDGELASKDYIEVWFDELPKRSEGFVVFSEVDGNISVRALYRDSGLVGDVILVSNEGDHVNSHLSSRYGILYFIGSELGDFNAYSLEDEAIAWNVPAIGGAGVPYFTGSDMQGEDIFIYYRSGQMAGYNHYGAQIFGFDVSDNHYPISSFRTGDKILVQEEASAVSNWKLSCYYEQSAKFIQQLQTNILVKNYFGHSSSQVLIFGNDAGVGKVAMYYVDLNYLEDVYEFTSDEIIDVTTVDSLNYLVGTTNGLYNYNSQSEFSNQLLTVADIVAVAFDSEEDQILISTSTSLFLYSYPDVVLLTELPQPANVIVSHVLYNK